jgi:uncharacterized membrane protein
MSRPASDPTSRIAVIMGAAVTAAGITHFAAPEFFDEIVPPWLPPSPRFWTYASGVAEVIIGPALIWRRTRRRAALAAVALFIAVYPANLYMAWDWRDRELSERIVSWVRLPFQFVFIWLAWRVHRHHPDTADHPDPKASSSG